jgi:hypothetical protein
MMKIYTPLFSLLSLFFLVGCVSYNDEQQYTGSHTGAANSEEFIQDEEIDVMICAAVHFAILALHEEDTESATELMNYLDGILLEFSVGAKVEPTVLLTQLKQDLNAQQRQRLEAELVAIERHIVGKLANNSIIDLNYLYSTQEFLTWMRDAAKWSSNGYTHDIVCVAGIAKDNHLHSWPNATTIDLFSRL